jgi:hypothetical protein
MASWCRRLSRVPGEAHLRPLGLLPVAWRAGSAGGGSGFECCERVVGLAVQDIGLGGARVPLASCGFSRLGGGSVAKTLAIVGLVVGRDPPYGRPCSGRVAAGKAGASAELVVGRDPPYGRPGARRVAAGKAGASAELVVGRDPPYGRPRARRVAAGRALASVGLMVGLGPPYGRRGASDAPALGTRYPAGCIAPLTPQGYKSPRSPTGYTPCACTPTRPSSSPPCCAGSA